MRASAHFLYISAEKIIKNGIVERNNDDIITGIFSLDDHRIETEQTIFHSGIIAPLPHSTIEVFSRNLKSLQQKNPNTGIFELLAKMDLPRISTGKKNKLVLIEQIDWEKKQITAQTVFRVI